MTTKRWMIPVGTLGAAALTLLPLPAAAAPASGTATPLQAVVTLLRPFYSGVAGNALACNANRGQVLACPITARLRYRLEHTIRFKENGNLVCRCQNPPRAVRWMQTDNNGVRGPRERTLDVRGHELVHQYFRGGAPGRRVAGG